MTVTDQLVQGYVDAAVAQLRRRGLMSLPGALPEAVRDYTIPDSHDWHGWKPIPSTVTDAQLLGLEQETGLQFPPLYRDFLQYLHFLELTECGLRFEKHSCDDWQKTLRAAYFESWDPERILGVGLLPFGTETFADAGPVCFDTRRRLPDGDCPIVFWDHEWMGTEREVRPLFSSCRRMFNCLTLVASTDVQFISPDEEDQPQAAELLERFLALDPEGAGGTAREYWTSWSG